MKLTIIVILLFSFSVIFCQGPAPLQPTIEALGNDWFKVTASVAIENITPQKAKNLAIQRACKQVIEYYCGVEISGRVLSVQAESEDAVLMDNFLQLINQTSNGIILEKEILSEKTLTEGNVLKKIVVLRVKAGKQKGGKDPYFNLDAGLSPFTTWAKQIELKTIKMKTEIIILFINISIKYLLAKHSYEL